MSAPEPKRTRLAVLGQPIAHSRSPEIHTAAYRVLGLDWAYGRHEVGEGGLRDFVGGLDDSWRGLSLTMPLKPEALELVDAASELARATGAVNTVVITDAGMSGHNTDVHGVSEALRSAGVGRLDTALVLGAGATAASVIAALSVLGARTVAVSARRREQIEELEPLAAAVGVRIEPREWGDLEVAAAASAIVNTVPGGAAGALEFPEATRRAVPLLDVVYDPWPSRLAASWLDVGGTVVSGLEMLVHQAVAQVRLFLFGTASIALPREDVVLEAMRRAVAWKD